MSTDDTTGSATDDATEQVSGRAYLWPREGALTYDPATGQYEIPYPNPPHIDRTAELVEEIEWVEEL